MGCVPRPMLWGLAMLALSSCATEACDCLPRIPAVVTGQVVREGSTPVPGAEVRAFSGPGVGCESLDTGFGLEFTGADGVFRLGLASGAVRERVCVLVFARPPEGVALGMSDTVLVVTDFRDDVTPDSVHVELVLGAE